MVKAHHLEPHLAHIVGAGRAHALGHHLRLFDNLLHGKLADDAAQVAFHHQADEALALVWSLGQELFCRGENRLLIGANLDLRDGFDGDGDALPGVEILLWRDVEAHQLEREFAAMFHHRKDHGAVPLDDARTAKTVDDERLIGAGLAKHLRHENRQDEGRHATRSNNDDDCVRHNVPSLQRRRTWICLPQVSQVAGRRAPRAREAAATCVKRRPRQSPSVVPRRTYAMPCS